MSVRSKERRKGQCWTHRWVCWFVESSEPRCVGRGRAGPGRVETRALLIESMWWGRDRGYFRIILLAFLAM